MRQVADVAKWVWATWQSYGLWKTLAVWALAGAWEAPLVGAFQQWPLWVQILASAGVAFVWLTILTWLINLFKRPQETGPSGPTATADHGAQAMAGIQAGHDVYQAGGDINVGTIPQPHQPAIPWINRPGGPQFRLSPGTHQGRLLCSFRVDADPMPGGIEARWVGAGTDTLWTEPMCDNVPPGATYRKYQMKPAEMSPSAPTDEVTFEVRFYLEDGQHCGKWTWPLHQHEKGHRILDAHEGSGVSQPRLEDTW